MRGCLFIYCLHWDNDVTSWGSNHPSDFVTRSFLDSRLQYESLEGLMDFLAFLVQKLWKNKQKIISGIPTNSLGNPYKIWCLMALTWAPETLGSRSRPLKLHIPAYNPTKLWTKILALCGGDDVIKKQLKKSLNYPFSNPTHRKPRTQIENVFFFKCKQEDFMSLLRARIAR